MDRLREIRDNGARMVRELELRERERTGIKKLKVGYNRVFGYYIDVPRSASDQVPDDYIRKQTLVSSERYLPRSLKSWKTPSHRQGADCGAGIPAFVHVRESVAKQVERLQATAGRCPAGCPSSLAEVAVRTTTACRKWTWAAPYA